MIFFLETWPYARYVFCFIIFFCNILEKTGHINTRYASLQVKIQTNIKQKFDRKNTRES